MLITVSSQLDVDKFINHNSLIKQGFKYKLMSVADHPLLRTCRNVENLQT